MTSSSAVRVGRLETVVGSRHRRGCRNRIEEAEAVDRVRVGLFSPRLCFGCLFRHQTRDSRVPLGRCRQNFLFCDFLKIFIHSMETFERIRWEKSSLGSLCRKVRL